MDWTLEIKGGNGMFVVGWAAVISFRMGSTYIGRIYSHTCIEVTSLPY